MRETRGCREVRVAGRGKGKSGGYRTITFFTGPHLPVPLITVFSKGGTSNLSKAERVELGKLTKRIVEQYQNRMTKVSKEK